VIEQDPGFWAAWSLLGEEADARGGGKELVDAALAIGDRPVASPREWIESRARLWRTSRPLDLAAVREAASHYAEAVRCDPPRTDPHGSMLPLERSTILSRLARAHAFLGEDAAAEAAWREAVDEPAHATWGYVESSFLLAELAYGRGEWVEARRLYDLARRSYWNFNPSELVQPPPGRGVIARIEQRRAALRDHCRVFGPILSTRRPGCGPTRGEGR
jgi:tetratricopeptide (TPR) repeat protein